MPKVSVIIPVFNVEDYLAECLDSVINQTFQDIEIICIDDASTDASRSILNEYSNKDPRITIYQNKMNLGQAATRNIGIEKAIGDYILFVDADDYIDEGLLSVATENMEYVNIVCFDYIKKDEIWNGFDSHNFCRESGIHVAHRFFIDTVNENSIIYSPWSKLYRRDFLTRENIRFIDGLLYEDIVFHFHCMMKAQKICCITNKLYIYRVRNNSTMTKRLDRKNIMDYFYIICYLSQYYLSHSFDTELEKAIEKYIHNVYRDFQNAYRKYGAVNDGYELKNHITDRNYAKLYGILSGYEDYTGEVQEHIACKIRRIKQAGYIIIYGAGDIARETIITLDKYDVAIIGVAVSDGVENKKSLLGNAVRAISDFVDKKEDSLVVIATTARFYADIEKKLLELGFQNYLEVF